MVPKIAVAGALSLAVALMAGCSGGTNDSNGSADSGSGSSSGLIDLNVAVVNATHESVIWYGIDSGVFKKHGLNVTTTSVASPIAASAAVSSGQSQLGLVTTPTLINANLAGTHLECVSPIDGQITPDRPLSLILASKKSGITKLDQLEGKKIAVLQQGSIHRLAMQAQLDQHGVEDPTYLAIPFPQMPQALASGRVDVAVIDFPYADTALAAGAVKLGDPTGPLYPNGTMFCYAGMSDYLAKNAKTAERFRDGMAEVIAYAKDHEHEVLQSLIKHMDMSKDDVAKLQIGSNFVPKINMESIGLMQDQMKQFKWIDKTLEPNDLVWKGANTD